MGTRKESSLKREADRMAKKKRSTLDDLTCPTIVAGIGLSAHPFYINQSYISETGPMPLQELLFMKVPTVGFTTRQVMGTGLEQEFRQNLTNHRTRELEEMFQVWETEEEELIIVQSESE